MAMNSVVQEIDEEIARLQQAKRLLEGGPLNAPGRKSAGSATKGALRGKRTLSAAGRKAIAAAQKARWAKVRKTQKAASPAV